MSATEDREGWGWPLSSRKAHYFREAKSLCGKWLFTGRLESAADSVARSPDDCVACRRKLDKEVAA